MRSLKKYVPNLLTTFRLIMAPVIFWLVIRGNDSLAMLFILLGATSDILDGVLARKWHACSSFGYAFEHSVDKIYLLPIVYIVFRYLNFELFFGVVLFEVSTILFSVSLNKKGQEDWPNVWGKLSYGFLIGSSCAALIGIDTSITSFLILGNAALMVTIILRIVSFLSFGKGGN